MRQSYEDAHKVLVLDRYLLEQPCTSMAPEEIAIRIMCAPWNKRLWTLQEGMLARSLTFQFSDTSVDLSEWATRSASKETTLQSLIFCNSWRYYASLRVFETEAERKMNILQANKALTFRSTSVSDDEPLCLGNLLGVDPRRVVQAGTRDERMKVIWQSVPRHFSSTVFWRGPKLTERGLRWAPATLMGAGCGRVRTCCEDAVMDPDECGLLVTLPGILVTRAALRRMESFRMIVNDKDRFIVQWDERWEAPVNANDSRQDRVINPSTPGKFAILLVAPMQSDEGAWFTQICNVVKMEEKRLEVSLLGRARLYRLATLKHHPDYLLPEANQSSQPLPSVKPLLKWESIEERVNAIWEYENSEIAMGVALEKASWCVN
jgi:hypothetical protein